VDVELSLPHPMIEVMGVLVGWCLPAFLLAYGAVSLAQRPEDAADRPDDHPTAPNTSASLCRPETHD
jgi:hypothetical protein